jgi:hypothetical protein
MKIVVLLSARDDLAKGFDFYEKQRAGLGGLLSRLAFLGH